MFFVSIDKEIKLALLDRPGSINSASDSKQKCIL